MKNSIVNMNLLIASVITLMVTMGGCKKYEEGPFISLRTKTERIANTWRVDEYFLNNTNQTSTIDTWMPNYTQTFTKEGTYSYHTNFFDGSGTWDFIDQKEKIRIVVSSSFGDDITDIYILKLKEKELWYYYLDGNDKHEFHLIPD